MSNHYKNILILIVIAAITPIWLHAQVQVSGIPKAPTCSGYTDGQITLNVTGGIAPYTYKWSNGQGGATVVGIGSGTYSVTVTDAANKTGTGTFVLTQPPQLVANIIQNGSNCDDNLSFTGSATGGTPPYSYSWRNLNTSQTINGANLNNPQRSTYWFEAKDANGCTANKIQIANGAMTVNLKVENVICGGDCDGVISAVVTGGALPYTYNWSYQNKTTQSLAPVPGGSYTVTVTDANGCQKVATGTVIEPEPLKVNAKAIGACTDNASGTVSPTGGKAPYSVKWSTGATGTTVPLTQGVHFVTVTDANGCSRSDQVNISKAMGIMVMLMQKDIDCTKELTSIEACIPGGGLGPYVFQWSNGMSSQVIMNVGVGTYSVTVIDGAGCRDSATTKVEPIKALKINASSKNSLCQASTGAATVDNVENATLPLTYKWSNNQTTASITGLAAGDYTVSVTDAKGCTATQKVTVNTEGGVNSIAFSKTDASCSGKSDGSATVQATGTGPFSYLWSNGATTQTVSNLPAGTYKVSVSNAAGCNSASEVIVGNSRNLVMKTSTSNAECVANSGAATVTDITGGTGPFIFRWSNGASAQTANGLSAGTYSVTVTDAQGCNISDNNIVVKANGSNVGVSIIKTDAACTGVNTGTLSAKATGTAPFTYQWNDNIRTGDRLNVAAGTYTVTVTDASGCKAEARVTINNSTTLAITTTSTNADCSVKNGAVSVTNVLGGVGPFSYIWSSGQTTQTASNIGAGTYSVTVTDTQGCTVSKDNITITANPSFTVSQIVTDATCNKANGKVEFTTVGGKAPFTYKWSSGTNTNNLSAGDYKFTITDSEGCTREETVSIKSKGDIKAAFTVSNPSNLRCDSVSLTLTNTSTGTITGATYRWLFSGNRTSTERNPTVSFGGIAAEITLIATNTEGCTDTIKQIIPIKNTNTTSVVGDKDTIVCAATPAVKLKATSTTAKKFEWSQSSTFSTIIGTRDTISINPTNRINTYYVRATDTTTGCIAIDTIIVNNFQLRLVADTVINACKGINKPFTINSQEPTDVLTVAWSPSTILANPSTTKDVVVKVTNDATLNGIVRNQYGCSQNISIPVRAREVDAKATISENVVYIDDQVDLNATPIGTGYTYQWTPATTITNPTSAGTKATPKEDTKYIVEVTDQYGCKDTASVTVKVLTPQCEEPYVFIPRAFSPNNDGINEKVFVRGEYLKEEGFEFAIYNRWGEKVFFTNNQKDGWDGSHKGQPVSPDVYGYYVKGICEKGERFFKKGNITVLK